MPSDRDLSSRTRTDAAPAADPDDLDDLDRWRRVDERPDNEVGVPVPLALVLGRTPDLAVVLTSVIAHSTGFGFDVAVRLRRAPAGEHDLFQQVAGHVRSPDSLLLGVEYADGRRGSVVDGDRSWPPDPAGHEGHGGEEAVTLVSSGGSGGGRTYDQTWWVHPLPPPGPVLLVLRWDAQGLAETAVEVDGSLIAAAGARAEELWPWEPERLPADEEADAPARPQEGWFAQG